MYVILLLLFFPIAAGVSRSCSHDASRSRRPPEIRFTKLSSPSVRPRRRYYMLLSREESRRPIRRFPSRSPRVRLTRFSRLF